ncbi:kinase-like protein [Paxillus ammoniavirescens]|nr:kinase-like protein [Paxillus ammoniavirescens]
MDGAEQDNSEGSEIVMQMGPLDPPSRDMSTGTAWNLNDIRSNFPTDLTGHVVREGEAPSSSSSFGDTYRGTLRMRGSSIQVAVKAIRTYSIGYDDDDAKRDKEIKTWLNLDHNNVIPLFGITSGFGRLPAMVFPWLENGSLTSYLERPDNNLTTAERLSLVSDVAAGLQYWRACISDFGLSTLLTQLEISTFATPSYQSTGTLRWTAPELIDFPEAEAEDDPPHIIPSPRSDVYSFGRIMLQILTGEVPYHYYPREIQVLYAISKGVIPKRPGKELVTDRQWLFMQQCWMPLDAGDLRPGDEEITEFVRHELAVTITSELDDIADKNVEGKAEAERLPDGPGDTRRGTHAQDPKDEGKDVEEKDEDEHLPAPGSPVDEVRKRHFAKFLFCNVFTRERKDGGEEQTQTPARHFSPSRPIGTSYGREKNPVRVIPGNSKRLRRKSDKMKLEDYLAMEEQRKQERLAVKRREQPECAGGEGVNTSNNDDDDSSSIIIMPDEWEEYHTGATAICCWPCYKRY